MGYPSLGQIDYLLDSLKKDEVMKDMFDYKADNVYEMLGTNTDNQHKRLLALMFNKKYDELTVALEESGLTKKIYENN